MLVWEAHLAIADAIGDSTLINSGTISDGVRFSKNLRHGYLYRAMLSVLNKRLLQLKGLSNYQLPHILRRFFPTSIHSERFNVDTPPQGSTGTILTANHYTLVYNDSTFQMPAAILSGRIVDTVSTSNKPSYPLPVKTEIEANGLLNGLNIQMYDNFILPQFNFVTGVPDMYQPTIHIYTGMFDFNIDRQKLDIELDMILMPMNPRYQAYTDGLTIDEFLIPEVINQAIAYAMVDSQDIEISPAYSQMNQEIDKLMLGIPQQGG